MIRSGLLDADITDSISSSIFSQPSVNEIDINPVP